MKILFIYAHIDDETILSYGTMKKFISMGHDVNLITFCKNRAGIEQKDRFAVYCYNMKNLGVKTFCNTAEDLSLTDNLVKYHIDKTFSSLQPEFVITHSFHDLHFEHRLIAEQVLLKARSTPNSSIKKLWQTTSSTYTWTYNQYGEFKPNVFVDISDYMQEKIDALSYYSSEIPTDQNDNRSLNAILNWNKLYGNTQHVNFCEPYEQIFGLI